MKKILYLSFISFFVSSFSFAQKKHTGNTHWPLELNSSKDFDVASKSEMLVFIEVFNSFDTLSTVDLSIKTKVKNIKESSVILWKKETKKRILSNFSNLSNQSLKEVIIIPKKNTWETLSNIKLQNKLPKHFLMWYEKTKEFYVDYIKEQIRLSALFPNITSEILTLSKNEIQGHNFQDKKFLLTFDDGPTAVNGNTDKLVKVLNEYNLTGMFFVLGDNLTKRLKASSIKSIKQLYNDNLVLSHGKTHKSHQKYTEWKNSIDYTNNLIQSIFPFKNKLIYFRPPYGQRNQELVDYFTSKKSKILYWNIDSRDWSSKLNFEQVANRQIKLMLLWRKGILLFHDIHSKAQKVTPIIYTYFKNSGITWINPHEF